MQLASQVAKLDERRQARLAGSLELARVLAQLRRDEGVAEERIQLLLAPEGVHFARLDDGDTVLGDGEPATLRLLAHGDVVLLRAGEVLEQVAVALGRDDAEVEAKPLLGDHRGLGVAVGDDLEHPRKRHEVPGQRRRIGGGGDHVEVAERLLAPPHAAGLGHVHGSGVRPQRLHHLADDRQSGAEQAAPRLGRALALFERLEDLLLGLLAEARQRANPSLLRRLLQPRERRHAELAPDARRRLRPQAGKAHERCDFAGNLRPSLGERVHLAGLDHLDDLGLDRLADARQLLRLPLQRQLGDGGGRLADPRRRAAVGEHAKRLLPEDLGEVGQEVELVGELVVAGKRGHVARS